MHDFILITNAYFLKDDLSWCYHLEAPQSLLDYLFTKLRLICIYTEKYIKAEISIKSF